MLCMLITSHEVTCLNVVYEKHNKLKKFNWNHYDLILYWKLKTRGKCDKVEKSVDLSHIFKNQFYLHEIYNVPLPLLIQWNFASLNIFD